jgi:hypothetical protein
MEIAAVTGLLGGTSQYAVVNAPKVAPAIFRTNPIG